MAPELLPVPLTGLALFSSESVLELDGIGFIRHSENFWQLPEGAPVAKTLQCKPNTVCFHVIPTSVYNTLCLGRTD